MGPGIKPAPPTLEGEVLTIGPPHGSPTHECFLTHTDSVLPHPIPHRTCSLTGVICSFLQASGLRPVLASCALALLSTVKQKPGLGKAPPQPWVAALLALLPGSLILVFSASSRRLPWWLRR